MVDCNILVIANAAVELRPIRCNANDATHSTIRLKHALASLLVIVSGNRNCREMSVARTLFSAVRTARLCFFILIVPPGSDEDLLPFEEHLFLFFYYSY